MRLDKYLAETAQCTRSEAKAMLSKGRVQVNGAVSVSYTHLDVYKRQGGVSVAIGELADGLYIDLNKVTKKYEGLDGTELAISASQGRMAVALAPEDVDKFIAVSYTHLKAFCTMASSICTSSRMVPKVVWRQ